VRIGPEQKQQRRRNRESENKRKEKETSKQTKQGSSRAAIGRQDMSKKK
jgi:hypothetical protein